MTSAANAFAAAVRAASGKANAKAIASGLDALVKARLRQPVRPSAGSQRVPFRFSGAAPASSASQGMTQVTPVTGATRMRRSARRRGRNQAYLPTTKVDISRMGTYRHYMLKLMREHTCTWDAERAHAQCEDPKFARNRLDFSWAASEGYIQFV